MQKQIDLRMKASKRLQQLRQQNNASSSAAGRLQQLSGAIGNAMSQLDALGLVNTSLSADVLPSNDTGDAASTTNNNNNTVNSSSLQDPKDAEIKALEEELRKRSKTIAWHQNHLADLGAVVEKRRFAQLTELKEAKAVLSYLFDFITKDKHSQIKSLESKISGQESIIESLKKQLNNFLVDQEKENANHSHLINAKQGTNLNLIKDKLSKTELQTTNSNPVTAPAKVRPPLHAPKNGLEGLIREVKSGKTDPKKSSGLKKNKNKKHFNICYSLIK